MRHNNNPNIDSSSFEVSDAHFKEWAELAQQFVENVIIGTTSFPPGLLVMYRELTEEKQMSDVKMAVYEIQGDFNEWQSKQAFMRKAGACTCEDDHFPLAIFLVSEVWVGTVSVADGSKLDLSKITRPRDDPNRKEAILVCGLCADGTSTTITTPVKRDEQNRMQRDGELMKHDECDTYLSDQFFYGYLERYQQRKGTK